MASVFESTTRLDPSSFAASDFVLSSVEIAACTEQRFADLGVSRADRPLRARKEDGVAMATDSCVFGEVVSARYRRTRPLRVSVLANRNRPSSRVVV